MDVFVFVDSLGFEEEDCNASMYCLILASNIRPWYLQRATEDIPWFQSYQLCMSRSVVLLRGSGQMLRRRKGIAVYTLQ